MQLQYLGHASFLIKTKVNGKQLNILTDPYNPDIGIPFKKTKADLVTISHLHSDHSYLQGISNLKSNVDLRLNSFYMNGGEEPFIVSKPGDYELKGIRITGVSSYHDDKKGAERGKNTIFVIHSEDFTVCHLGDLGHLLLDEQIEEIGDVDVLLIPVGGYYTIDPEEASKVIAQIEPSYVVPMHFKTSRHNPEVFGNLKTLNDFLETMGAEGAKTLDTFNVTKSTSEETEVIVLNPLY